MLQTTHPATNRIQPVAITTAPKKVNFAIYNIWRQIYMCVSITSKCYIRSYSWWNVFCCTHKHVDRRATSQTYPAVMYWSASQTRSLLAAASRQADCFHPLITQLLSHTCSGPHESPMSLVVTVSQTPNTTPSQLPSYSNSHELTCLLLTNTSDGAICQSIWAIAVRVEQLNTNLSSL